MRLMALGLLGITIAIFLSSRAIAQRGLSIEAGLLHDRPNNNSHDRPFSNMKSGFGYIGNLGYDFFNRFGLEVGVMHTTHAYDLAIIGDEIIGSDAEKTTFFIKARGIPLKWKRLELVTALGAGYFDISGDRILLPDSVRVNEDFSGWGLVTNLNLRYHATSGLAVTFYLGANFVNYKSYSVLGYKSPYAGRMPGGDSIDWGITIFHRIGIPQI